jgi:hypothetical protein
MALSWEENLAISGEEDHLIRVDLAKRKQWSHFVDRALPIPDSNSANG